MITGLKPYVSMKNSGVNWLGEIPAYWEVRKLRSILKRTAMRNRPDLPLLSVVREKGVILRDVNSKDENPNFIPDDLTNYKVVRKGQFAMNKMKAWQGSYGISRYDGIVSPAYFIFDVEGVAKNYFHIAIRSKAYVPFFTQASDGVRIGQWDLSQARMREISFIIPPLPEQAAIVWYLEHVDRRVRRLVRAKRKLIPLLTEQKQAIIHRAVTRGLDPNLPLKDSGVKWLGQVPEHWEVRRLFQACDVIDPHPSHRNPPPVSDGVPFLGVGDLNTDGEVVKVSHRIGRDILADQNARFRIEDGDLAIGRVASVGKVVRLRPSEICLSGRLAVLKPKIGSDFLFYCLGSRSTQDQIAVGTDLTTMGVLGLNKLKRIYLCVPPVYEQSLLAQHIIEATSSINRAIARTTREIELLNEYRTRLIAEVVTGKLDVREAAASLPDESVTGPI